METMEPLLAAHEKASRPGDVSRPACCWHPCNVSGLPVFAAIAIAATAWTLRMGGSLMDRQFPASPLGAVEGPDGCIRLGIGLHLHEAVAFALTGRTVADNSGRDHCAKRSKQFLQVFIVGSGGQTTHVDTLCHGNGSFVLFPERNRVYTMDWLVTARKV